METFCGQPLALFSIAYWNLSRTSLSKFITSKCGWNAPPHSINQRQALVNRPKVQFYFMTQLSVACCHFDTVKVHWHGILWLCHTHHILLISGLPLYQISWQFVMWKKNFRYKEKAGTAFKDFLPSKPLSFILKT